MPLAFSTEGQEVRIVDIKGNPKVKQRIMDMGFHINAKVSLVRKLGSGIIVRIGDSEFALDRDMALKIMVGGER